MIFSVVIAVRNEVKYIEKCIESIFSQDYKKSFEVLVVDGMSSDGTYELLKKLQNKYDFKLFRNPKINAAAGRNIGIKNSDGEHIAFIDGDAVANRDWLSQIKRVFDENNVAGVGGPDLLPEDSSDKARNIGRIMTSPLARGGKLNPSTQHSMMEEEKYVEHIPTCNLSLKREVFNKVGMFDENFIKGQDLELNFRIINAGYKLLYSPKIKVVHYRKQSYRSFSRQIFKWAKAKVAIIKKHGFHDIVSHVYLWPVYGLVALILSFTICYFLSLQLYVLLLIIGVIGYISIIFIESVNLAKKFNEKKLAVYGLLLFPIVHISYFLGVLSAIVRKNIW